MRTWLLRRLPWWIPMAMWYPVMAIVAAVWLWFLTVGPVGLVIAALDLDGWRLLRALWALFVGLGAAAWWFQEWESWRELTPRVLRDGLLPKPIRRNSVIAWFREGYEEGKNEAS